MSVEAISNGERGGYSRRSRLLAWVWADPREDRGSGRDAWLAGLLGWLWPSALHDERFGRRHGLMAALFGWAWPTGFDGAMKRFWRKSWLWAWMWPGRVAGPDGEICPLAPWHPAVRPEICEGEPWTRKVGRHGGMVFMMFAAGAIAAPTFMAGNNGELDGGRLSLFRSDPVGGDTSDPGAGGGGGESQPGGGAGGGGSDGGTGGVDGGPQGDDPPTDSNPGLPGDSGGDGFDGGLGGDTPGDPGPGGGDPSDPGLTFLDPGPDGGDDLGSDPALGLGGSGSGGGSGGGGGGGTGGGGGDPTDPEGGDPFTPPNPPPVPLDPPGDKPVFPQLPGVGGPTGEGGSGGGGDGGGGGGCLGNCAFLPNETGPTTDDPRLPAGAVPEPGTWAMMILGFGLAGYAIRRRRVGYSLS